MTFAYKKMRCEGGLYWAREGVSRAYARSETST